MKYEQKIWKISPGTDGEDWDDCLSKGVIGIGWEHEKDIHGLSKEEVMEYIKEEYNGKVATQFVDLIFNIKEKDIVIAYSSPSTIYGIGIVDNSEWVFDDGAYAPPPLTNSRKIRWDTKISDIKVSDKEIVKILGYNRTLFGIENDFFITKILPLLPEESYIRYLFSYPKISQDMPILNLLDHKSQIILYGPPGTGKTYKTREYAVNFIQKSIMEE